MINKPITIKSMPTKCQKLTALGRFCNIEVCIIKIPALEEFIRSHFAIYSSSIFSEFTPITSSAEMNDYHI